MEIIIICILGGALLGALIPDAKTYAPYCIEGEPTVTQLDYLHQCYKQDKIKQRYGVSFDEYVYTHMQQRKYQ